MATDSADNWIIVIVFVFVCGTYQTIRPTKSQAFFIVIDSGAHSLPLIEIKWLAHI